MTFRFIIINGIIGSVIAFNADKPFFKEMFLANNLFIIAWFLFTVMSIIFLWGYSFYHWGTNEFKNKGLKSFWFFILIAFMYIGAFVYYIIVDELKIGLLEENRERISS